MEEYNVQRDVDSPVLGRNKNINIPIKKICKDPINPRNAYRLVEDELLNEGNAR